MTQTKIMTVSHEEFLQEISNITGKRLDDGTALQCGDTFLTKDAETGETKISVGCEVPPYRKQNGTI